MLSICESYLYPDLYTLEENKFTEFISKKKDQIIKKIHSLFETTPKKIDEIEKKLQKNGINISKIKAYAEKESKKIKLKNGKFVGVRDSIQHFVKDIYAHKFSENEKVDIGSKIIISVVILAVVVFINSLFFKTVISLGVSPKTAMGITSIICAPIVEETGKMFSIQAGATGIYYVIFNTAEFLNWVVMLVAGGASLGAAILIRIPPLFLHLWTTVIQSNLQKKGQPYTGYGLGVIIHALWNTMASLR